MRILTTEEVLNETVITVADWNATPKPVQIALRMALSRVKDLRASPDNEDAQELLRLKRFERVFSK